MNTQKTKIICCENAQTFMPNKIMSCPFQGSRFPLLITSFLVPTSFLFSSFYHVPSGFIDGRRPCS
ncbi:hypothetical protein LY76DRAFT_654041 [Colletotrichum caudatum]|nr:hypothetical protein LY76DRAFT_654041 [Colletotrichum caudatum]